MDLRHGIKPTPDKAVNEIHIQDIQDTGINTVFLLPASFICYGSRLVLMHALLYVQHRH